jgi:hypothetical protein
MLSTTDIRYLLNEDADRYIERTVLTDFHMHEADGTIVKYDDKPVIPSEDQVHDLMFQSELICNGRRYTIPTRTGWPA